MTQGVLPYGVEVVDRADTVTGRAGLPLVIETLRALGLHAVIADQVQVRERASGYTETEKLGRRLPSADRWRHFLYVWAQRLRRDHFPPRQRYP